MLLIGRKPHQTACMATPEGELMTVTVKAIRAGVVHFVVACSHRFKFNDLDIPSKRTEGSTCEGKSITFRFPSGREVTMIARSVTAECVRLGLDADPRVVLDREEIWQKRCRESNQLAARRAIQ